MKLHIFFWAAFSFLLAVHWYNGSSISYFDLFAAILVWGHLLFDHWYTNGPMAEKHAVEKSIIRAKTFVTGYAKALEDFEELLDNAKANNGGIDAGNGKFIQNAHWDFEIRDQVEELRENMRII